MRAIRVLALAVTLAAAAWACWPGADAPAELEYVEMLVGESRPGEPVPLFVGVHGLGDRPESFGRTFSREFPIAARFVFPRAPIEHGDGFSWFAISTAGAISENRISAGVKDSGKRLAALIDKLTRVDGDKRLPVVFGYSQGGMLSFYLASRHSDVVAAAVPIAGFLPTGLAPSETPAPVFAFHGREDELVPVTAAHASIDLLREHGGVAQIVEYPRLGHAVSVALVKDVQRRLAALARPTRMELRPQP